MGLQGARLNLKESHFPVVRKMMEDRGLKIEIQAFEDLIQNEEEELKWRAEAAFWKTVKKATVSGNWDYDWPDAPKAFGPGGKREEGEYAEIGLEDDAYESAKEEQAQDPEE